MQRRQNSYEQLEATCKHLQSCEEDFVAAPSCADLVTHIFIYEPHYFLFFLQPWPTLSFRKQSCFYHCAIQQSLRIHFSGLDIIRNIFHSQRLERETIYRMVTRICDYRRECFGGLCCNGCFEVLGTCATAFCCACECASVNCGDFVRFISIGACDSVFRLGYGNLYL